MAASSKMELPAKGTSRTSVKNAKRKLKTKRKGKAASTPVEHKYRSLAAGKLPWRRATNAHYDFEGFEAGEGGMLELEEIDGVDVVWEDTADGGKSAKFRVREDLLQEQEAQQEQQEQQEQFEVTDDEDAANEDVDDGQEWAGIDDAEDVADTGKDVEPVEEDSQEPPQASTSTGKPSASSLLPTETYEVPFDDELLPEFMGIPLLPSLKRAIHSLGFTKPSEIQKEALTAVLAEDAGSVRDKDIVGVAETGSGKTLAYSLPILQHVLANVGQDQDQRRPLAAVILCPTRELAMQVKQHVGHVVYKASIPPDADGQIPSGSVTESPSKGKEKATKYIPRINIVTVCGGMSIQKQKRLLSAKHGVDIIVATPGRLWELISSKEEGSSEIGKAIKGIKFLVLDEADRMVEGGHFAELDSIVDLVRRARKAPTTADKKGKKKREALLDIEEIAMEDDFRHAPDSLEATKVREDINTYVFSATMSKELQRNLKRHTKRFKVAEDERGHLGALGTLLEKLDFRDPEPTIIDLSTASGVVSTLQEVQVECLTTEKDYYLYYFLLRYPGRTLVFLGSIDGIRRLHPLLEVLKVNVAVIHSGMQQRARLKALDRFRSSQSMVLLATDVAARGLDVPAVDHVVHYQLPRTADAYIHRSGRTARAGNKGVSLQLVSPDDKPTQRGIMKNLGRDVNLKALPVEFSLLTKLKERVELARKIENAKHKADKASHDDAWLRKAAEEMELDVSDEESGLRTKKELRSRQAREKQLTQQLQDLLAQPITVRGISSRYITSGGNANFASQMLAGTFNESLIGIPKSKAVDDL